MSLKTPVNGMGVFTFYSKLSRKLIKMACFSCSNWLAGIAVNANNVNVINKYC